MINLLCIYPESKPTIQSFENEIEVKDFLTSRTPTMSKEEKDSDYPVYIINQLLYDSLYLEVGDKIWPEEDKQ